MTSAPSSAALEIALSQMVTEREAAGRLAVTVFAMRQWRYRGGGPKYVKLGHAVRYRLCDIEAFIQSNLRDNSSQS